MIENQTKGQDGEQEENRRNRIRKSVKAVIAQLVRAEAPGSGRLCRKEVAEELVNDLDKNCTRKVQRKMFISKKNFLVMTKVI